jgi:hypothetical protein
MDPTAKPATTSPSSWPTAIGIAASLSLAVSSVAFGLRFNSIFDGLRAELPLPTLLASNMLMSVVASAMLVALNFGAARIPTVPRRLVICLSLLTVALAITCIHGFCEVVVIKRVVLEEPQLNWAQFAIDAALLAATIGAIAIARHHAYIAAIVIFLLGPAAVETALIADAVERVSRESTSGNPPRQPVRLNPQK